MVVPVHKNVSNTAKEKPMTTDPNDPTFAENSNGLTKREYFAAAAIQGLCADPSMREVDKIAKLAVEAADALIVALGEA